MHLHSALNFSLVIAGASVNDAIAIHSISPSLSIALTLLSTNQSELCRPRIHSEIVSIEFRVKAHNKHQLCMHPIWCHKKSQFPFDTYPNVEIMFLILYVCFSPRKAIVRTHRSTCLCAYPKSPQHERNSRHSQLWIECVLVES